MYFFSRVTLAILSLRFSLPLILQWLPSSCLSGSFSAEMEMNPNVSSRSALTSSWHEYRAYLLRDVDDDRDDDDEDADENDPLLRGRGWCRTASSSSSSSSVSRSKWSVTSPSADDKVSSGWKTEEVGGGREGNKEVLFTWGCFWEGKWEDDEDNCFPRRVS